MSTQPELAKDLEELQKLRSTAARPQVQKLLDAEIKNVNQVLEKAKAESKKAAETPKPSASAGNANCPTKKITTFAFDESRRFVKLYYTLNGVQNLPEENIESSFTDNSFNVYVKNLDGVNYTMEARGLTNYIDVENSTVKQKSDMLLVMLKKIKENLDWGKLLALEKKEPPVEMPKLDEGGDPQDSLMKMMKSMYDTGDDEMKRSIKKAFYESNQKKQGGGGGIGDFNM